MELPTLRWVNQPLTRLIQQTLHRYGGPAFAREVKIPEKVPLLQKKLRMAQYLTVPVLRQQPIPPKT